METGRTQKVRIRPPLLRRASRTRRAQQARTLQQKLEVWHQGRIRKLGLRRAARDPWLVTGEDRNEKCWNGALPVFCQLLVVQSGNSAAQLVNNSAGKRLG